MTTTINLSQASPEQLEEFLDSFDVVLSDCDGVIWYLGIPIPGAIETISKLQALGKRVYLLTNNSTISIERYCEKLRLYGLNVQPDQIINTAKVISWYLRKINFKEEAFVIGQPAFQQILKDSGIKLAPTEPNVVESDPRATVEALQDRPSVKAVIVDFALHFDWAKSALAISCLQRNEVLYISGAQDKWVACGSGNQKILGPGPFIEVITRLSGREPIECAKPSEILKDYVLQTCHVKNPERCLLIGDAVQNDMKFGTLCGFQKLFVETGVDTITEAKTDPQMCPDYYSLSLGLLKPLIESIHDDTKKVDKK